MIQWIFLSFLFIFNFIFKNMKHPLAMSLTLLIQTTLVCMTTGLMTKSFWFSNISLSNSSINNKKILIFLYYIMFLVFLGRMLVLFIYVTSLASNEMFSFSVKLLFISLLMFVTMMILLTSVFFIFSVIFLM